MLLLRVGLPALILLSAACSSDKKNDEPTAPTQCEGCLTPSEGKTESVAYQISFQNTASLDLVYGDYFSGYKSYRFDTSSSSLTGNWDRLRMTNDPEPKGQMVRATSTVALSAENRKELEKLVSGLNNSMVILDKSECGNTADGPINSFIVTEKSTEREVRIADARHVSDTCADSYVTEKSLDPVLEVFTRLLPQPEDDSSYQPL